MLRRPRPCSVGDAEEMCLSPDSDKSLLLDDLHRIRVEGSARLVAATDKLTAWQTSQRAWLSRLRSWFNHLIFTWVPSQLHTQHPNHCPTCLGWGGKMVLNISDWDDCSECLLKGLNPLDTTNHLTNEQIERWAKNALEGNIPSDVLMDYLDLLGEIHHIDLMMVTLDDGEDVWGVHEPTGVCGFQVAVSGVPPPDTRGKPKKYS